MASNKQILRAYKNKAAMQAEVKEIEAAIKVHERRLGKLKADLDLAQGVGRVIDGIPVSVYEQGPTAFDMHTLASGDGIVERRVHAYQVCDGKHWYVRLYEGAFEKQRFHGGKVIGFSQSWTKDQAREISERWLKGDEEVLHIR